MREEPIHPRSRKRKWILRSLLYILVAFLAIFLGGNLVFAELPVHVFLGWIFHAFQTFPSVLAGWRGVLLPAACLLLAGVLAHRLIARGVGGKWKPMHTASAFGLVLLGCVAAISLSAVVHQFAWLSKDRWIYRTGVTPFMRACREAGQLALLVQEFHDHHGHLPHSLSELPEQNLIWVYPDSSGPREPFLLLNPGGHLPLDPEQPILISPVILPGRMVAGKADGSITIMLARELPELLKNRRNSDYQPPARHE